MTVADGVGLSGPAPELVVPHESEQNPPGRTDCRGRSGGALIGRLGHRVEIACDGHTAIDKARANSPDLLLCDIGLPWMSGYEVVKALRATGANGTHFIAVSGDAQAEDVKRAIEAGCDAHVAKPPDIGEIERLLD